MHAAERTTSVYAPGLHGTGAVDPVAHAEPTGQSSHSVADVRPTALEYVPEKHGMEAVEPGGQKAPGKHNLHSVWRTTSWNSPAAQAKHVSALGDGLYVPGEQGVAKALPTLQEVPSGHSTHWSTLVITVSAASL